MILIHIRVILCNHKPMNPITTATTPRQDGQQAGSKQANAKDFPAQPRGGKVSQCLERIQRVSEVQKGPSGPILILQDANVPT